MNHNFPYLIIGGGIAGVTCAETLHYLDENAKLGLITSTDTIKSVTNLHRVTKLIEDFNVIETSAQELMDKIPQLTIIKGVVESINIKEKYATLEGGEKVHFLRVCICTGGRPKLIEEGNEFVVGIRDTESVEVFKEKLKDCKKVAVVGNGGIATELVYEISDCELLWLVKDKSISSNFFDSAAAEFLLSSDMSSGDAVDKGAEKVSNQRHHFSVDGRSYITETRSVARGAGGYGGALGPDWAQNLRMRGASSKNLLVKYEVEVREVVTATATVSDLWLEQSTEKCPYKVALLLTDDSVQFCDLVVSATGVRPYCPIIEGGTLITSSVDGGVLVDENMCSSVEGVYAAGDCCSAGWSWAEHWMQMRLWAQARTTAFQAAKCMHADLNKGPTPMLDFGFELFTHVTKFFGYSVILLGLYNGQTLQLENNERAELLIRTSPGVEYIKCVVVDGRVKGAILIGDTEMAETLEDLILDQIDISSYGESLLDPNIDVVDFFD